MQYRGLTPIGSALIELRGHVSGAYWPWIGGLAPAEITQARANAFLLGSILQTRTKADLAWENVARFLEAKGGPDDVWAVIRSLQDWELDPDFAKLHRYPQARMRVHRTALRMVEWDDDARRL